MGVLGGLASSTATTISFSTASRRNPALSKHYARAVVLASSVMLPRVFLLVLATYPSLLPTVGPPLVAMLVSGLVIVFLLRRKDRADDDTLERSLEVAHPLRLSTAIKFGLAFAVALVAVEFAQAYLGSPGVYVASVLAGLTDVDAITLSVARLASNAQLALRVAGIAIIVATLANTFAKGAIAYSSGSQDLRRTVVRAFSAVFAVGVVSTLAMLWLT
jgi:uncharacterized membrane protein (DUF4010 family)